MINFIAVAIVSITFMQPLPFQPSEAFVSINGFISNSSDPALTTPRSVSGVVKVGAANVTEIEIDNHCEIHLHAYFDRWQHRVIINVEHSHAAYSDFANPIGTLEYEVTFDKYKVGGIFSWDQSRKLERPLDIFQGDERYDPSHGLYLAFDWVGNLWSRPKECKIIPGRKYLLEFEYIVSPNSFNVGSVEIRLSQYMDGLKFWKQNEEKNVEILLKVNGKWNKFSKVIYSDNTNTLMIRFNSTVFVDDKDCACALYIRNAKLIPMLQSDLVHGP